MGMNTGIREWATWYAPNDATNEMVKLHRSYPSVQKWKATWFHFAIPSKKRKGMM